MNIWKRFVKWMNRGPRCDCCGKEMKRYEGMGAGFWVCICNDGSN